MDAPKMVGFNAKLTPIRVRRSLVIAAAVLAAEASAIPVEAEVKQNRKARRAKASAERSAERRHRRAVSRLGPRAATIGTA